MKRLTGIDELGYYFPLDITLNCLKHRGECVDHLGAYEDTGLSPGEIVKMGMMFEDSKRYSGRLELKLREATRWIPVSEQLPKDRGDVLAVVFWHEAWQVKPARCNSERKRWYVNIGTGCRSDIQVSHWMPLPKPPKEDAE